MSNQPPSPYDPPSSDEPHPYDPNEGPPKSSGLAIASLITSLAGIITCGVSSLVGLILGIVALSQIKATGAGGRGLAIAGVVIGAVIVLFSVLAFGLVSTDSFHVGFAEG